MKVALISTTGSKTVVMLQTWAMSPFFTYLTFDRLNLSYIKWLIYTYGRGLSSLDVPLGLNNRSQDKHL